MREVTYAMKIQWQEVTRAPTKPKVSYIYIFLTVYCYLFEDNTYINAYKTIVVYMYII